LLGQATAVTFRSLVGKAVSRFSYGFVSVMTRLIWRSVQEQSSKRSLIVIAGFIHDVSGFIDEHPGGSHLIIKMIGKDATTAFFGGVYDHSNAAHNVSEDNTSTCR